MRHEGLRLKPYQDSVGVLTIGYGRNLEDNGISRDEAIYMLRNDIEACQDALLRELPWITQVDMPRRTVLLNMCFNLGIGGLLEFRNTLRAVRERRYEDAADGMLHSLWARQVGSRAVELAKRMRTGALS